MKSVAPAEDRRALAEAAEGGAGSSGCIGAAGTSDSLCDSPTLWRIAWQRQSEAAAFAYLRGDVDLSAQDAGDDVIDDV